MIIIVFGLPGTGKTTFAKELARQIDGVHISSDKLRHELKLKGHYGKQEKEQVYQKMYQAADWVLQENRNVVLDGTFYQGSLRMEILDYFFDCEEEIVFIEMLANEEDIKERVEQKRSYSEADFEVYLKIKAMYEPLQEEHLRLDTSLLSMEEMIRKTINYLNIYQHGKTAYFRATTSQSVP